MKKLRIILVLIAIASLITGIAVFLLTGGLEHDVSPLVALGEKYLEEGDYEEAALQFEKAISIAKKTPEAWYGAARAYIGLGEEDEAIEALKVVAELDPSQEEKIDWMIGKIEAGEGEDLISLPYDEKEPVGDVALTDSDSNDVNTESETLSQYASTFSMITGEEFSISVRVNMGETYVTADSGCLGYYMTPTNFLVAANYINDTNTLEIETFDVVDNNDVRECAKIQCFHTPIYMADKIDLRIAYADLPNGKSVIVIESTSGASTYADGGGYEIELIEISEDGQLSSIYNYSESGSDGDETNANETLPIFNSVTGCNYSKYFFHGGCLEGMFTDDIICSKFAGIYFMSDAAKVNNYNVWDDMNEYGMDARYPWGTGTFSLKN